MNVAITLIFFVGMAFLIYRVLWNGVDWWDRTEQVDRFRMDNYPDRIYDDDLEPITEPLDASATFEELEHDQALQEFADAIQQVKERELGNPPD